MDSELRDRLVSFLRPLYQDLDGVSRFDDVERIERIARAIHQPQDGDEEKTFTLLILFHGLARWLQKVGNVSRTALAVPGVTEGELRRVGAMAAALDRPGSAEERALAAAILIDGAGVRGLALRFTAARREGQSLLDVVREALADSWIPEWVPPTARPMLERRIEARRRFCREILEETAATP